MSTVISMYPPLKIQRFAYCVNYSTSSSPQSVPKKWKSATIEEYNKDENEDFQHSKQKHASVSSEAGATFDEEGNQVLDNTDVEQKWYVVHVSVAKFEFNWLWNTFYLWAALIHIVDVFTTILFLHTLVSFLH